MVYDGVEIQMVTGGFGPFLMVKCSGWVEGEGRCESVVNIDERGIQCAWFPVEYVIDVVCHYCEFDLSSEQMDVISAFVRGLKAAENSSAILLKERYRRQRRTELWA